MTAQSMLCSAHGAFSGHTCPGCSVQPQFLGDEIGRRPWWATAPILMSRAYAGIGAGEGFALYAPHGDEVEERWQRVLDAPGFPLAVTRERVRWDRKPRRDGRRGRWARWHRH